MRIVTQDGTIYADGRFYSPARLRGADRFTDLDIFLGVSDLGDITKNEKGEKGKIGNGSWQKRSIFHVIDKSTNVFSPETIMPDILVCDDSPSEIADFVAIETINSQRIVLLHAKNGSGAGSLSVGNLHVVVSQAKKNLGIFDPSEELPLGLPAKWNGVWRTKGKTLTRIRPSTSGSPKGKEIVDTLEKMRAHPSTQKEVWLVLGNMFGKKDIERVIMTSGEVNYRWIQMLYLLHSLHASVVSIGGRLRILVGP